MNPHIFIVRLGAYFKKLKETAPLLIHPAINKESHRLVKYILSNNKDQLRFIVKNYFFQPWVQIHLGGEFVR